MKSAFNRNCHYTFLSKYTTETVQNVTISILCTTLIAFTEVVSYILRSTKVTTSCKYNVHFNSKVIIKTKLQTWI